MGNHVLLDHPESAGVLLLSRADVAALLPMRECIDLVEDAFRLHGRGELPPPGILGAHCEGGGFHLKTAFLSNEGRCYFAAKANANFPGNPRRLNLPTIQGIVSLSDATNGRLLAVMDSAEITAQRTGAATAVAARYLARPDSRTVTICGCGVQGEVQLKALRAVLPLDRCYAFDVDERSAVRFAASASATGIHAEAVFSLRAALAQSDVCVTCTPSHQAFLMAHEVRPGTFVAAVGADNPEKQELDPCLLARSKVVADILEQCATIGDLHHAIEAGMMTCDQVHAELGAVVAGLVKGRETQEEVTVFDSTGTALQDVAAAVAVYRKARSNPALPRWNIGRMPRPAYRRFEVLMRCP